MRSTLLKLHMILGLAGAVFITVMALTGCVIMFEDQIDHAMNANLLYVTPQGQPKSLSDMLAAAVADDPKDPIGGVRLPEQPNLAYEFTAPRRKSVMVNPYTASVIGTRDHEQSLARFLHLLHSTLLLGEPGTYITGTFALFAGLLGLSGLVLWWPRKVFGFGARSWKDTNFSLHNTVGICISLVMVLISLTGASIALESENYPALLKLNGAETELDPSTLRSTPIPGASRVPLDDAAAIAGQALPGAVVTGIGIPRNPTGVYSIGQKFPEDHTPAGRSHVYLDQFSGKVLGVASTRTAPLGRRVVNLRRPLHAGDMFGAPSQAVYFLVSLGIALQAITGVFVWWNSRRSWPVTKP